METKISDDVQGKTPRSTGGKMSKIIEALEKLAEISDDGNDTLVQDGACEPTRIADIIDECRNADEDVSFTGIDETDVDFVVNGDGIWRMRPDGYQESVATYRVVPIVLPDNATVFETMFEYVDSYDTNIDHYVLKPGVNEIRPHDDSDFSLTNPDDIEDPVLSRYAAQRDLVQVTWGEKDISLMPSDVAWKGIAYVVADSDGKWIGPKGGEGWFEWEEDAEKAWAEWQISGGLIKTQEKSPAKYGSRGETTLRLPIPLRDRLLVVAAHERLKMKDWILVRIEEKEEKYGIVPPMED